MFKKQVQGNSHFHKMYRYRMLYAMILPAMITTFIFCYIPMYGVLIAFKDYSTRLGIWGSKWVGLKHFKQFMKYPYFGRIVWNSLKINFISLLTFPCPIIFAIMLNELRSEKFKKICQTITYAPYFVSVVLVASITMLFVGSDGPFNVFLGFLGIEKRDWMGSEAAFPWIYVISDLWSTLGWNSIIYIAALSGVSSELIEAAKIDGAGRLRVIWHICLPHLKPTAVLLLIMRMGSMLSVGFEKALLLQNDLNKGASSVIATYTYEIGIEFQQFSYSTAIGLFNCIVSIVLVFLANIVAKKLGEEGLF